MKKEDNKWEIDNAENLSCIHINGEDYFVSGNSAAICHALLLLVDAVNDKKIG